MKKTIVSLCILLCAGLANAQFSQFHTGLMFPTGKFGNGDVGKDILGGGYGFSTMGIAVGFKRYNPFSTENLTWVFGIDAFMSRVNNEYRDNVEDAGWSGRVPIYFNFPLTAGLNYAIPATETVKIYGEIAIGGNLSMMTAFKLEDKPGYEDMTYSFTPAFGFAYGLEGGLFINNKYSIGLRYNNLGSYRYKYTIDYSKSETKKDKFAKALPITNVSLCLGVLF